MNWNPKNKPRNNASSLHKQARELLKEEFPFSVIFEEVKTPKDKLYFDFFLPLEKVCLEVQGKQHYEYTSHFHTSSIGFLESKKRDRMKKEWCEINQMYYIELPYNEDINEWRKRIQSRGSMETS